MFGEIVHLMIQAWHLAWSIFRYPKIKNSRWPSRFPPYSWTKLSHTLAQTSSILWIFSSIAYIFYFLKGHFNLSSNYFVKISEIFNMAANQYTYSWCLPLFHCSTSYHCKICIYSIVVELRYCNTGYKFNTSSFTSELFLDWAYFVNFELHTI